MNQDIFKIRREKWLKHQQYQQNEDVTVLEQTNNLSSPNKNNRFNQAAEVIDITSSPAGPSLSSGGNSSTNYKDDGNYVEAKERNELKKTSGNSASSSSRMKSKSNLKPKPILNSIDLTLSSDDDDDDDKEEDNNNNNNKSNNIQSPNCENGNRCNDEPTSKKRNIHKKPYSATTKLKQSSSSSLSKSLIPNFSICTYNIWFGPPHQYQRMEEISNIISRQNPKPIFIGLQEVTSDLLLYLQPFLESMGYRIIAQDGLSSSSSYGVAIAVLISALDIVPSSSSSHSSQSHVQIIKSGFHPFQNTIMGRGLLWVHGKIRTTCTPTTTKTANTERKVTTSTTTSNDVLFTTTHLESFIPKNQYPLPDKYNHDGVKARKNQMMETIQFCNMYYQNHRHDIKMIIVTGDLNWDDERKKGNGGVDQPLLSIMNQNQNNDTGGGGSSSSTSTSTSTSAENGGVYWRDAWKVCHSTKQDDGYTYDSKLNPMLKGNLRRRFDRCLYYYPNSNANNSSSGAIREDSFKNTSSISSPKKSKRKKHIQDETSLVAVTDAKLVGTSAIDGIEWIKEVSEWKYGKPTGKMTKQKRPVCPSDHFGLVVSFFGTCSSSSSF